MYSMESLRDMGWKALVVILVALLFTSTMTKALPAKRSSARNFMFNNGDNHLYMSDGILRDFMMQTADLNGDHKLSEYEIAWFYRHVVAYTAYVADVYGSSFIAIADMDHDGLLDGDELLQMIVAMSATDWTKRR